MPIPCPQCGAQNRVPAHRLKERAKCGRCKTPLTPLGEPVELASVSEFDDLTQSSPLPVLVDFWANWCAPCRMLAPELKKLAKKRSGSVVVAKVNTEELPELAARYDISGIPSLMLFERGKVTRSTAGLMSAETLEREMGF